MSWNRFNNFMTGNPNNWNLKFKTLYSEVFKNHRVKKDVFVEEITDHPKPWKWLRVFLFLIVLSVVSFLNTILVGALAFPWLALIVASVVPITVAMFLYECITHEKPKVLEIVLIFMVGTTVSFLATGFLSIKLGDIGLDAVLVAPIIEEIAKAIPIVLAIKILKIKRVSTAILIGWIVGSGFEIAETLGYSTYFGYLGIFSQLQFLPNGTEYVFTGTLDYTTMFVRFFFSFGSHAFWGAIEGAAFIFSQKKDKPKMGFGRLVIWLVICIVLHMLWNTISTYISNLTWSIVLTILVQLIHFPLFFYLLDAGISDNKNHKPSHEFENPVEVETFPTSE